MSKKTKVPDFNLDDWFEKRELLKQHYGGQKLPAESLMQAGLLDISTRIRMLWFEVREGGARMKNDYVAYKLWLLRELETLEPHEFEELRTAYYRASRPPRCFRCGALLDLERPFAVFQCDADGGGEFSALVCLGCAVTRGFLESVVDRHN